MTELLERHNPDAGESIVVDVLSETEDIDEVASAIATNPENIHPKKFVYTLPRDHYRKDLEDVAPMIRIFQDRQVGIKHPNEIKSSISMETSIWYVEAFKVRVPHGWVVSIPMEEERVCTYRGYRTCIYPKCFLFGMRLPFSEFQKEVFDYFRLAPSMIMPNSWKIMVAFEALCVEVVVRPTARLFRHFYQPKKSQEGWFFFSKQTKLKENRLFGGLDESIEGWKPEYWLITADPQENPFDFHHHWVQPIHKEEFPEEKLGAHDRTAAQMIKNWVTGFLTRRAVVDSYELNADLIMKRFIEGDIVFELPPGVDGEEGVVAISP